MADTASAAYRGIRSRILVALILVGLLPLGVMEVGGVLALRSAATEHARSALEAMVKNRKATVDLFLEEKLRRLALVAHAYTVDQLARTEVLEALRQTMQLERGGIIDLGVIDENGRHLAYVGPYDLRGRNYAGEEWFRQVMVRGRYESDVFLGFRRFPHMVMAVKKTEDARAFVLRATLDTDLLSTLVREGGLESGADVFILNRRNEYQTEYSPEHRLMEKADSPPVPRHSGVRLVALERGHRRELMATAWLHGDDWVLVARRPLPGLLSQVLAEPVVLLWLPLLGVLAIPLLAYVIARHRLRQIRALEANHAALYENSAQTQKMAAIGRMAASIAHEINNPLAIIHAQVGVLRDEVAEGATVPDPAELRARLDTIARQVERGRKVTHRLLGFSRRMGPELELVDVKAALEETIGFLPWPDGADGTRIVRQYQGQVPLIHSHLAQVQQVLLNLVHNAVDAMGGQGQLTLGISPADGGVEVRIADTGPGIPPEDLERIFEPFYSTKAGAEHHSGLGLAICRETMRTLNGRIRVESTPGSGATFILWFPCSQPTP